MRSVVLSVARRGGSGFAKAGVASCEHQSLLVFHQPLQDSACYGRKCSYDLGDNQPIQTEAVSLQSYPTGPTQQPATLTLPRVGIPYLFFKENKRQNHCHQVDSANHLLFFVLFLTFLVSLGLPRQGSAISPSSSIAWLPPKKWLAKAVVCGPVWIFTNYEQSIQQWSRLGS
jgi:hypothetical protein